MKVSNVVLIEEQVRTMCYYSISERKSSRMMVGTRLQFLLVVSMIVQKEVTQLWNIL